MAGLPKKYAKMGFAKGWKAYKATKRQISSSKRVVKTTTTRRKTTMARKRRSVTRKIYRRSSKKSMFSGNTGLMLGGAGYGIIREPLSRLTANIPYIGGFGDEVALLGASYLLASKTSGIFRTIGKAGLVIESHNLARQFSSGMLNMGGSQSVANIGIR